MGEIGDNNFSVLIDGSRHISVKEKMEVMLRFVVLSCNYCSIFDLLFNI
jgi:hypothetical protein